MDKIASVLLAFPPSEGFSGDDDNKEYDLTAKAHVKRLNHLMNDKAGNLAGHAAQLLQHVNPAVNSISYLYLLHSLYVGGTGKQKAVRPDHLVTFITRYDPRQIRYAGHAFSDLLRTVQNADDVPQPIAVQLLATALRRLDPTGGAFTSHHLPAVQLAYRCNAIEHILPIIDRNIVFYPGMRGQVDPRPLCDRNLSPASYITIESGLTMRVSPTMVLEYDFCVGLCQLHRGNYVAALQAFERVLTYPSKEQGCSKIMVEAHNKWVLTSLLTKGKVVNPPSLSQSVSAAFTKVGQPYLTVAAAFVRPDNAVELQNAINTVGMQMWAEEANEGLIREVQAHYQRHHILRLSDIYTKLSLEDIRTLTQSAETGGRLDTAGQVEGLLDYMTSAGMLRGVITKPPGSVSGDGQGYLTFLPADEDLTDEKANEEIRRGRNELAMLAQIFLGTKERLAGNTEYVKHLVKNENAAKFSGVRDVSYDSQVEDEDLMGGN